jgi:hypothetical protein
MPARFAQRRAGVLAEPFRVVDFALGPVTPFDVTFTGSRNRFGTEHKPLVYKDNSGQAKFI